MFRQHFGVLDFLSFSSVLPDLPTYLLGLSCLCNNLLCLASSPSAVQIITHDGNTVFFELCFPGQHQIAVSLHTYTPMENILSQLIMSSGKKKNLKKVLEVIELRLSYAGIYEA